MTLPAPASAVRVFATDERGGATLLTAFVLLIAIGIAAISIDGGNYFYLRRVQQSATDIAAVSAAANLTNTTALATLSSSTNGFAAASVTGIELGTYTYSPAVAPQQRFVPAGTTPNAVRVSLATQPPFIFGGLLNVIMNGQSVSQQTGFKVRTQAVAVNQDVAAFALGSGLATLNGGVENAILSALLGSQVSLSLMDWQALASANVDLFAFATALNTRARLNAVTFGGVAAATVTRTQALQALADALAASGAPGAASSAFANFLAGAGLSTAAVPIASLVSYGPFGDTNLTAATPLTARVSALDLVSAIVQLANGRSEVQTNLALGLPGIAGAHLNLVIGQPPVSTSLITVGAKGATLYTAQTRAYLSLTLIGSGLTPLVTLPLYVELAPATAQLTGVACVNTAAQATLGVTPGIVDAWIGVVSDADLTNLAIPPSPSPATIFNLLGLAQVTGRAHAALAAPAPTAVTFSQADIAAMTRKTTSTTDFMASLYASLIGNLGLNVTVLGSGLGVPAGLDTSVKLVLSGAATPVDQAITIVLSALGLSLGNATTWVSGVKCGRSTLVN